MRSEVKSSIGWWGADCDLITGQAIVTRHVVSLLERDGVWDFSYRGKRLRSMASTLWSTVRLICTVFRGRVKTIYLVCSRSNAGFLRDLPAYLVRRAGVRVVVHVHGTDIIDLLQRPVIGTVARWAVRGCTLILPSGHLVEPLSSLGVRDYLLCENFVAEQPAPPQPTPAAPDEEYVVLWNSNVMASKGFFAVAEAVAHLHAQGQRVRLLALGAPLADEALTAAACAARLARLVKQPWMDYRGPVDRSGAREALLACDVVCLPSHYASECQPLALLEAMCACKPLLVADTAALRATVGSYPCEVVTRTEAPFIAQALQRGREAAGAVQAVLLQAAGEEARRRFSTERFDRQMHELLGIDSPPGFANTVPR
jgi:glycosyltransferase involved in cell wall biosynthesis